MKLRIVKGAAIQTVKVVDGVRQLVKSRGLIVGNEAIVRGDDRMFGALQITRHEATHKRIERGEIDVGSVVRTLQETVPAKKIREMVELYSKAYGDSGMNGAEVLEEIICDAMGEMNVFATRSTRSVAGEVGVFLRKVRQAVQQSQNTQQTGQQGIKNPTGDGGVKQSAKRSEYFDAATIREIQSIGRKSVNDFSASDLQKTEAFARQYWKEMGVKSPFFRAWFGDWRANDTTPVQVADQIGDTRGVQKNQDTGWDIQVSGKVFNETRSHKDSYNIAARPYLPYINDIVSKAILLDSYAIGIGKTKSENSLLMHSLYAVADIGQGVEIIKLYVEEMNNPNSGGTNKRAYQLQNIEKYQQAGKSSQNTASSISPATAGTIRTVADLFAFVKKKDSSFKPSNASKVVNADGTPKVMYHGSRPENGEFTVFDYSKAKKKSGLGLKALGAGNYFTSNADVSHYAKGGKTFQVYLDIKNPVYVDSGAVYREEVGKALKKDVTGMSTAELQQELRDAGYDGVISRNTKGEITVAVTFDSEQVKSATDNVGTFDGTNPDIRYSREMDTVAALEQQNKILRQQKEYWKGQARSSNGHRKADAVEVRRLARNILSEYSSTTKVSEIADGVQWLADQWADPRADAGYSAMADYAVELAREIVAGSEVDVNESVADTYAELKAFLRKVRQAVQQSQGTQQAGQQGAKKPTGDGGVKYARETEGKYRNIEVTREERIQNIIDVAGMDEVYTVAENKLNGGENALEDVYTNLFAEWGNVIHSEIYGDIDVKKSSVKSEMGHGNTRENVASIEAIPYVLERGKIIGIIPKETNVRRIVVAAPIKIGNVRYYMGVMLNRDTSSQRLYLHDVVINKEVSGLWGDHLSTTRPSERHKNLFLTSILGNIDVVKYKKEMNQKYKGYGQHRIER